MADYYNHEQRLADFKSWLPRFQKRYSTDFSPGNTIPFDDDAAQIMNDNYWTLRSRVNDFMSSDTNINMSKIAAGVQTVILLNQPFDPPALFDDEATKEGIARVNSEFAWSFCLDILLTNIIKFQTNENYKDKLHRFYNNPKFINLLEYHLLWCQKLTVMLVRENKEPGELLTPYFLLSQFWQTLECWLEEYLSNPTN